MENPFAKKINNTDSKESSMPTDNLPSQTVIGEVERTKIEESSAGKTISPVDVKPSVEPLKEEPKSEYKPKKKIRPLFIVLIVLLITAIVVAVISLIGQNTNKSTNTTEQQEKIVSCQYDGVTYSVGSIFQANDGCNTCGCGADGEVSCTLIACESEDTEETPSISLPVVNPL